LPDPRLRFSDAATVAGRLGEKLVESRIGADGSEPWIGVAVNPAANMIYVADFGHYSTSCSACVDPGKITMIDGATNSTVGIYDSNAAAPQAVAVNSATNKIYVANNLTAMNGGRHDRNQC
jgi:hypothetical protein